MVDKSLVVVGAGIAGLSTAVTAAENGAVVTLIDRAEEANVGGNTRYTEAFMRMKSTREVADDFERHFAENASGMHIDPVLMGEALKSPDERSSIYRAASLVDPDLIHTLAVAAGSTLEWLEGKGIRFEFLPSPFITTCTTRLAPIGGGRALVEALYGAAMRSGIDIRLQTTAVDLHVTPNGAVAGVFVRSADGVIELVEGDVMLACGGFEGNAEMMSRYLGPGSVNLPPVSRGGRYNKGEGIAMALRHGAAPSGDFSAFHAEPVDPRSGMAEAAIFIFPYGILVNRLGERFVDEAPGTVDAHYESITREIYHQPGSIAYTILDAQVADVPNRNLAIRTDKPPIAADSLPELARLLKVPVDRFTRTVAEYNAATPRDGISDPMAVDGLATNGLSPVKSNWARSLEQPPFTAYPTVSSNVFTFGGLKVDNHAQVLNTDGTPIPGLYAAGEVMGLYFGTYTGATSVLRGAVFGRLAGEKIASLQATEAS